MSTYEKRHDPPGVNSRSLSVAHTAADLEVLREIENVYFSSPSEFDAARYVLSHAPSPPTCEAVELMFTKLKRQQQVVSGKALHLISQQRDNCDREFTEIQNIRQQLAKTLDICRKAREHLSIASNNLTISTFVILANVRKRQIIKSILKSLELLQSLRSVEKDVAELLNKKEYYSAIELIQKSRKAAAKHKEYTCIADLSIRLNDTLDMTEEKLDSVLANICYNFDEDVFKKLKKAYDLLGKTQAAMEQLHMHYSSAVNESAIDAMKPYTNSNDMKFQDICGQINPNKAPNCLLNLCEKLFLVMRSYYLLVDWHNKYYDEEIKSNNVFDIERNVSKEYIRQKLKAGLIRIWNDVQAKVSTFLKSSGLEDYPFEKFIQMLGILRKLTQVAEIFCGDKSDLLQDFIKTQSVSYIKNYHKGRMDELKLFLENEGWEQCPVKSTFNLLNLQEFKQFKKYLNPKMDQSLNKTSTQSETNDTTSSIHSQDDSLYIARYFKYKTTHTPFEIFRNENITNDDIFGIETELEPSDDSEDEPDELKRDYVDDDKVPFDKITNNKDSVIVTNTTLSVLRNCGQYLQIIRYLPQISLEVIMLMNQLFDYYFYAVHLFFTSDLEVASSTLYTSKLTSTLKRISNNINSNQDESKNFVLSPELPQHLDMNSEATLHGLSERIVAVESVIFLAKQFELLQPYLETIVAQHQKMILEHFKDNTLAVATDLRMPIYMCSAAKAVDARSSLIAMSQVKWDVKNVAVEHSPYVDMIVRKIQVFALRLENISTKVSLNRDVLNSIWSMVSKFIVHLLVEGFSNATKCTNGGRGLMQLDYRQLFVKLEKISGLKPIPYQDYVDRYVKAYYLPRKGLEEFVQERIEYSNKHLLALVTCACENKRDRQALTAIIEGRELSQ
ncbi:Coiled-coil domain-containing protein 132 [Papilio machaon]|uniref:Coiled-coil domain-containing protein 132 n=1 Tax=Papilio machaon TaxID=76193 RepID=A0A0N0PD30_PAPMA|nr:Coiled-coil domain-containing protein 132 [Papilio machaon]